MIRHLVARSRLIVMLVLAGAACTAHGAAQPVPPAASFFANRTMGNPVLSPNARFVAVRVGEPGQRDRLAVIDIATNTMQTVAAFGNGDIGDFQWVNDRRLAFDTADRQSGERDLEYAPGLFAVDRDGTGLLQLASRFDEGGKAQTGSMLKSSKQLPWNTTMLGQAGKQDSDLLYVVNPIFSASRELVQVRLQQLNTRTSKATPVSGPPNTFGWVLDHKGEPRLAVTLERDVQSVHLREGDAWRKLASFNAFTGQDVSFAPLAFGPDGTLFIETAAGKDMAAVHTYDIATGKISAEPLIETVGYDFTGSLITGGGKLLGMQLTTDAKSTIWFDEKMKAVQKEVDKALNQTVNIVSVAARPEIPVVLVTAYSDTQPPAYLLYNTDTRAFTRLGASHAAIRPEQMGRQEPVRYTARDGLAIPALLTLPPGGKRDKLPLVVMVHGGPWVRGASWGWNPVTQFLATRGYAVIEPEFRGSVGFGNAHFRAGWKQWGLAMQDDIADAAKWAIASGIADPGRICIAGASYGGYATLMGLARDPGLFKCGVSLAGVTDIGLLFSGHWGYRSDLSERYRRYGMPELVGDPDKDAARFAETSPLQQAARIRQPLLLAHGSADRRVPLYHGEKFYKAVRKTNPGVEWIQYDTEGHGLALPENRIDFWTRVEKFLGKHIGSAEAKPE